MLIGRQESADGAGIVDLLAIDPDASLILIELKRDKTPRDVIAQTLDYASWLTGLSVDQVAAMYGRFKPGGSLADDFKMKFGRDLVGDEIKGSHQLVVVASSIDARTERIVRYLAGRDVPINLLTFDVFEHGDVRLLSRAWILDPVETQVSASNAVRDERGPWNGEFYACFGHGESRSWDEARNHGFLSAGGGAWYSNTLNQLTKGARVWVNSPGYGFVGVGLVIGPRMAAADFRVDGRPALDVLHEGHYHRMESDADRIEYFVPIRWLDSKPIGEGIRELGLFGNQNTVCKPRTPKWAATVNRLKVAFPHFDQPQGGVSALT